jgi:hypothetical protein
VNRSYDPLPKNTNKYKPEILFTMNLPYEVDTDIKVETIRARHFDFGWSNDLNDCIYSGKTTLWFASQIAVWMGFKQIYWFGVDIDGPRIPGHPKEGQAMPGEAVTRQLELFGYLRALVDFGEVDAEFYNCSMNCPSASIPKVPYINRHFIKNGAYDPAMDIDITIRRPSRRVHGGGTKVTLDV